MRLTQWPFDTYSPLDFTHISCTNGFTLCEWACKPGQVTCHPSLRHAWRWRRLPGKAMGKDPRVFFVRCDLPSSQMMRMAVNQATKTRAANVGRTKKYNIGATTYLFDNIGKPSNPLQQFPRQAKRSHAQSLPLEPSQKLTPPARVPTASDDGFLPNFRQCTQSKPVQLLWRAKPSPLPVELTGPQQAKSHDKTTDFDTFNSYGFHHSKCRSDN